MFKVSKEQLQKLLTSGLDQDDANCTSEFKSTKQFEECLNSNIERGLGESDIPQRQQVFGINEKEKFIPISLMSNIWSILIKPKTIFFQSMSMITLILTYLSTDGVYTNEWIESITIFVLISLNSLILESVYLKINDNNKKRQQNLEEQLKSVVVLRNGKKQTKQAKDIVVGDIVILNACDKIYVDGLIVEQFNLLINQSFLTGEDECVRKITLEEANPQEELNLVRNHLIFAESQVMSGQGKLLVLAVGPELFAQKILNQIKQERGEETPIYEKIKNISNKIEIIGFVGCIIVILIVLARYMIQYQNLNGYSTLSNILNFIIVLLSWNSSKTMIYNYQIRLAQTLKQMLNSQSLVRKQFALENLPFMNQLIICTESLYQNIYCIDSFLNDTNGELSQERFNEFPQEFKQAFIDSCIINNTYNPENESYESITEKGFYLLSQILGIKIEERKSQVTHFIPSSSKRRRITTIIDNSRVVVKGSFKVILESSNKFYSLKDGIIPIDDVLRDTIEQNLNQIRQNPGVMIAIAFRDVDLKNENVEEQIKNDNFQFDNENLTLLGFFMISNQLKSETKRIVEQIQQAGVKVILVGQDSSQTIQQVAVQAGIITSDSTITEGVDFSNLLQNRTENYKKEIEDICVISRSTPINQQNIVYELQKLGHVVGVIGDSANSAFAIKSADVGYCIGKLAMEKARESSGIVLVNDSLDQIYIGLILARNLLDSITRLVQYQITTHSQLITILIASLAIRDIVIISPLQIFWINLITDLFASIILSYCKPSANLFHTKSFNKQRFLLDIFDYIHIIILSVYIIALCILFGDQSLMVFNILVITNLFNLINSRMVQLKFNILHEFCCSWMIYISILMIGLFQYLILEQGGIVLYSFNGLSLKQWLVCIAIGIGSIILRTAVITIIKPNLLKIIRFINQKSKKAKLKVY
ncbi:unnamed protein product [Paramecium sonneborni]|uniref:Cation-transporting P-type ATPase N-terminal domain-containing protein n=1 Tax=Paramecium sonneborni TaxID=65129 RepID=A0A8S1P8S7_9CILI|nr:unnamed protein product [Paramecium sonneborni]